MKKIMVALIVCLQIFASQGEEEKTFMNLELWSKLSKEEKIKLVDNYYDYKGVIVKFVTFKDISGKELKEAVKKMKEEVLNEVSTDNIDSDIDGIEGIFSVGEPVVQGVEMFKIEKKVVAISLTLFQAGGATKDRTPSDKSHYNTVEEAKKAGHDAEADVSWQVNSFFGLIDGKWKALDIDIYNEGFSWSGW